MDGEKVLLRSHRRVEVIQEESEEDPGEWHVRQMAVEAIDTYLQLRRSPLPDQRANPRRTRRHANKPSKQNGRFAERTRRQTKSGSHLKSRTRRNDCLTTTRISCVSYNSRRMSATAHASCGYLWDILEWIRLETSCKILSGIILLMSVRKQIQY